MEIDIGDGWRLRRWRQGDQAALVRYADNRNVSVNLRDRFPHPYTKRDADEWIERCLATSHQDANFAIAGADEVIGGIGVHPGEDVHAHTAEVGYWLGEPFWGRGIATRALHAVTRYGFQELGLERLWAAVFEGNDASRRVLEKAGYVYEGCMRRSVKKDGRIRDAYLYAILRSEGES